MLHVRFVKGETCAGTCKLVCMVTKKQRAFSCPVVLCTISFPKHLSLNHWMVMFIVLFYDTVIVWWSCSWLTLLFISVLSSAEVLYFDSGSLGLQQWNQWWVYVLVWHLHLAFLLSRLSLPPPSRQRLGGVVLKVRKGSLFFLNPLPSSTWSTGCACVSVLRKCVDRCL